MKARANVGVPVKQKSIRKLDISEPEPGSGQGRPARSSHKAA